MDKYSSYKQNESGLISKSGRNYFWSIPFGFPMSDPYNTGPMSEPVLSPAGQIIMPRRNPYYTRPTDQFLNPYTNQMRKAMFPIPMKPDGSAGVPPGGMMPHPGQIPGTPQRGPAPGGPMGPRLF